MTGIRPNVLRMRPYSPGKPMSEVRRELGLERVVKLASNENPLGPSPKAVEAVQRAAAEMHLYPDASAYELKAAIAQHCGVPEAQIVLGNGSDELIHYLGLVLLGSPDDEMVVADPSFVRYDAAAELAPCKLVKVPLNSRYAHDLPKMADAVTERTKLVFIANPNNPTGTIVRRAELNAFLERIPEQVLVVLDEAYFEFAREDEEYPDGIDYLHRGKNVVVMRTFSKTYGLAGLRIGYLFAQSEVTDAIERVREPFNVNSLGQAAAVAALSDSAHIERTVQNNRHGIGRISEALSAAGAEAGESFANFVFADLKRPARPVFEALLRRGVIIRSGEAFGTPTCVRVSVGTDEEIDIFVEEFRNVMQELDR